MLTPTGSFSSNLIDTELTQWRVFVDVLRSPSNTWPKCPSQRAHMISILTIPWVTSFSVLTVPICVAWTGGGIGVGVNVGGTGCTSISVEYTCIRHRGVTMSTDSNVREKVSINPLTLVAFIKSRPSTARIKFGLSGIQRIAAGSAFEVTRGGVFFV